MASLTTIHQCIFSEKEYSEVVTYNGTNFYLNHVVILPSGEKLEGGERFSSVYQAVLALKNYCESSCFPLFDEKDERYHLLKVLQKCGEYNKKNNIKVKDPVVSLLCGIYPPQIKVSGSEYSYVTPKSKGSVVLAKWKSDSDARFLA